MKAVYFERTAQSFNRMTTKYSRGLYVPETDSAIVAEDVGIFRNPDYRILNRKATDRVRCDIALHQSENCITYKKIKELDIDETVLLDILGKARGLSIAQTELNKSIDELLGE